MKKILLLIFLGALFIGVNAQLNPGTSTIPWNTTGNSGTTNSNFLGTTDCVPLIFKTNNVERMRLLGGKSFFGIGTAVPDATLHLHFEGIASLCEYTPPTKTMKLMQLTTFATTHGFDISYNLNNDIKIQHYDQTNFFIKGPEGGLTIAPDGNIGMGTDLPKQKLHIEDGNLIINRVSPKIPGELNGALIFDAENSNPNSLYNTWGIERVNSTTEGFGLNFWTYIHGHGTPNKDAPIHSVLFLGDNSNVGIGTRTPTAALDVNGSLNAESAKIYGIMNAQNANIDRTLTTGVLKAQSASISGNLSVNTLSANTLSANNANINGEIKAKAVEVTLSGWKDYVFYEDYNLMSLAEVEQFIAKNYHLPDVPSAAEVEANGVNLGEMSAILIQKVEELTLYIIQLEKRLSEVEKKKEQK